MPLKAGNQITQPAHDYEELILDWRGEQPTLPSQTTQRIDRRGDGKES